MSYTYRHRTLRPLALSVHTWFLGTSIVTTVFAGFVLRELDLEPWAYGLALAFGGVGGFLGALLAPRIGARIGAGQAILVGRVLVVLPWLALAVVPITIGTGTVAALALVSAAQFVYGLAMGIEDPNDTGYRQSVAPDSIQGRMNSTIRTANRVVLFSPLRTARIDDSAEAMSSRDSPVPTRSQTPPAINPAHTIGDGLGCLIMTAGHISSCP